MKKCLACSCGDDAEWCYYGCPKCTCPDPIKYMGRDEARGFEAGISWTNKNPSDAVNGLVEVLRTLRHLNHHIIEEEIWRIDSALAAYKDSIK